ncbi:unnamed protein product, partial [Prorocentrum cordatum]
MASLLRHTLAPATTLERVELNLEWVFCLQQTLELTPPLHRLFTQLVDGMVAALSELQQGNAPPSLAAAAVDA